MFLKYCEKCGDSSRTFLNIIWFRCQSCSTPMFSTTAKLLYTIPFIVFLIVILAVQTDLGGEHKKNILYLFLGSVFLIDVILVIRNRNRTRHLRK